MGSSDALRTYAIALMQSSEVTFTKEEQDFISYCTVWPGAGVTAASDLYSTKLLVHALNQHSEALSEAAEASDRTAQSLNKATWMLVFATVAIVIATLLELFGPILLGL